MRNFDSSEPDEVRREAMNFNFEQKLTEIGIDQKKLALVKPELDHYRQLVASEFLIDQQEKTQLALLKMLKLHKDQADRPGGKPYISHPIEVSRILVEEFGNRDVDLVSASLLHDSVEDQAKELAFEEIRKQYGDIVIDDTFVETHKEEIRSLALKIIASEFSEKVARILDKLSNPDFDALANPDHEILDKNEVTKKKNNLYLEHVKDIIQDPDVLVIKLADFLTNFTTVPDLEDSSQKTKFIRKYVPVAKVFIDRLNQGNIPETLEEKKEDIIRRLVSTSGKLT